MKLEVIAVILALICLVCLGMEFYATGHWLYPVLALGLAIANFPYILNIKDLMSK